MTCGTHCNGRNPWHGYGYMAEPVIGDEATAAQGICQGSKVQALREALKAGPMTAAQLARAAGVEGALVPPLLQWSVGSGRVLQLRDQRPFRYALPESREGRATRDRSSLETAS